MATPVCPPHYVCTFTPNPPDHVYDPWWTGPWGQWIAVGAVIAAMIVLIVLIVAIKDAREDARDRLERERERQRKEKRESEQRQHALDVEEQRTMQLDAAKGNPEMLRIVREMQKES
jgi:flagellar biosynthesis/type III secretory pathway M-ring protein FliF/YscJ